MTWLEKIMIDHWRSILLLSSFKELHVIIVNIRIRHSASQTSVPRIHRSCFGGCNSAWEHKLCLKNRNTVNIYLFVNSKKVGMHIYLIADTNQSLVEELVAWVCNITLVVRWRYFSCSIATVVGIIAVSVYKACNAWLVWLFNVLPHHSAILQIT